METRRFYFSVKIEMTCGDSNEEFDRDDARNNVSRQLRFRAELSLWDQTMKIKIAERSNNSYKIMKGTLETYKLEHNKRCDSGHRYAKPKLNWSGKILVMSQNSNTFELDCRLIPMSCSDEAGSSAFNTRTFGWNARKLDIKAENTC